MKNITPIQAGNKTIYYNVITKQPVYTYDSANKTVVDASGQILAQGDSDISAWAKSMGYNFSGLTGVENSISNAGVNPFNIVGGAANAAGSAANGVWSYIRSL